MTNLHSTVFRLTIYLWSRVVSNFKVALKRKLFCNALSSVFIHTAIDKFFVIATTVQKKKNENLRPKPLFLTSSPK